jgi:hypothetical protein
MGWSDQEIDILLGEQTHELKQKMMEAGHDHGVRQSERKGRCMTRVGCIKWVLGKK